MAGKVLLFRAPPSKVSRTEKAAFFSVLSSYLKSFEYLDGLNYYHQHLPAVLVSPETSHWPFPDPRAPQRMEISLDFPVVYVDFSRLRSQFLDRWDWLDFLTTKNQWKTLSRLRILDTQGGMSALTVRHARGEEGRYYPVDMLSLIHAFQEEHQMRLPDIRSLLSAYTLVDLEFPKWVRHITPEDRQEAVKALGAPPAPLEHYWGQILRLARRCEASSTQEAPVVELRLVGPSTPETVSEEALAALLTKVRYPGTYLDEEFTEEVTVLRPALDRDQLHRLEEAEEERRRCLQSWKETIQSLQVDHRAVEALVRTASSFRERRTFTLQARAIKDKLRAFRETIRADLRKDLALL